MAIHLKGRTANISKYPNQFVKTAYDSIPASELIDKVSRQIDRVSNSIDNVVYKLNNLSYQFGSCRDYEYLINQAKNSLSYARSDLNSLKQSSVSFLKNSLNDQTDRDRRLISKLNDINNMM